MHAQVGVTGCLQVGSVVSLPVRMRLTVVFPKQRAEDMFITRLHLIQTSHKHSSDSSLLSFGVQTVSEGNISSITTYANNTLFFCLWT